MDAPSQTGKRPGQATEPSLKLVIQDDQGTRTDFPLRKAEITIGRQQGNTIRLTDWNVSRKHARITTTDGQVAVEDLGSYNGIKVNGVRISQRTVLSVDDRVEIGDYVLELARFERPAAAAPAAISPAAVAAAPVTRPGAALGRADTDPGVPPTPAARPARASKPPAARTTEPPPTAEPAVGTAFDDDDELAPPPRRTGRAIALAVIALVAVVGVVLALRGGKGKTGRKVAAVPIDAAVVAPPVEIDAAPAIELDAAPMMEVADAAVPDIDAAVPDIDAAPPPPVDAAPPPPVAVDAAAAAPVSPDQATYDRFVVAARRRDYAGAVALYNQLSPGSPLEVKAQDTYDQLHLRYVTEKKAAAKALARAGKCRELQALSAEATKVFPDAGVAVAEVQCQVVTAPTGSGGGSATPPAGSGGGSATPPTGSGGGSATPTGPTAAELAADAQAAAKSSQWSRAMALADKALKADPDAATRMMALSVAALAACNIPDADKARRYYAMLPPNRQSLVRQRCIANGVNLD